MRASRPEPAYSPAINDNRSVRRDRWRFAGPRWAAAIAVATLLGATTVHGFVFAPRGFKLPPDFNQAPCHESTAGNDLPAAGD